MLFEPGYTSNVQAKQNSAYPVSTGHHPLCIAVKAGIILIKEDTNIK